MEFPVPSFSVYLLVSLQLAKDWEFSEFGVFLPLPCPCCVFGDNGVFQEGFANCSISVGDHPERFDTFLLPFWSYVDVITLLVVNQCRTLSF
jgi:hypothetical protein